MDVQAGSIPPPPPYRAVSRYDDVWTTEEEICAYCATPVASAGARCPGCGQRLEQHRFLYDTPSSNYVTLWVMIAGSGFLYLILVMGDILQGSPLPLAAIHFFLGMLFLFLSAAIYLRQFWAWAASIPILLVTLFLSFIRVIGVDTTILVPGRLEEVSQASLNTSFLQSLVTLGYVLLLTAQGGALLWAIFLSSPDFTRRTGRLVARLESGLVNAADYYTTGNRYAKHGAWATAILHWQRAAAAAPHNWRYLLALAQGYAELGFFERSADVLQSAERIAPRHVDVEVERLRQQAAAAASKQG